MKNGIPHRNWSPHGWWIASYVLRTAWDDQDTSQVAECTVWENTIILQAIDREAAYEKTIKLGTADTSEFESEDGTRKGRWIFEGLTSLLPIYDELKDGTEILWAEHENCTLEKVRSWVKEKNELEAFDDTPAPGDKI